MIDQTVPGGIYKDAIGDGYHDAHGNPVDAPVVAEQTEGEQANEQGNQVPVTPVVVPVVDDAPVADPKRTKK